MGTQQSERGRLKAVLKLSDEEIVKRMERTLLEVALEIKQRQHGGRQLYPPLLGLFRQNMLKATQGLTLEADPDKPDSLMLAQAEELMGKGDIPKAARALRSFFRQRLRDMDQRERELKRLQGSQRANDDRKLNAPRETLIEVRAWCADEAHRGRYVGVTLRGQMGAYLGVHKEDSKHRRRLLGWLKAGNIPPELAREVCALDQVPPKYEPPKEEPKKRRARGK